MATLRAKKPEVTKPRVKALIYADKGVGKTHFCCSLPGTYYIDSEGLKDYPKFVKMIRDNDGVLIYLTELSEMIEEVRALLSVEHNYKTLIIDSLSFPYAWLNQLEAERLAQKPGKEGTEYSANTAKAKRLIFQLGILLTRLDMNVFVISHEKAKYIDGEESGKTFDIYDKMAYSLGSTWNLRLLGKTRKLFIEKTRYDELKTADLLDFNDGYEVLKNLFGEETFIRKAEVTELATPEQIATFDALVEALSISEEVIQKWLIKSQATLPGDMSKDNMQKYINAMNDKLKPKAAA